jgi:hypothetical protein
MSMSSGINHLRIFLMNIFYHRTFKKLWYMFEEFCVKKEPVNTDSLIL